LSKEKDLIYWLWLSLTLRQGSVLPSTLLKYFGSPRAIYEAGEEDLAQVETNFYGHEKDLLEKSLDRAEDVLSYCKKNKIGIATPDDFFYPQRLKALPNKPMVLYYLGNFCDLDTVFSVGVVGSRDPSAYGIHAAKRLSLDLARAGAVIISGVAAGIDSASHRAALYNESFTVGILGCGIDRVYPKENEALYEEIIRHGLLMTEYPPGTAPMGRNFPVRNRLIAALSDAVLVVEGSESSGSLITAEDALNQKKALYTVPGSIFSRGSAGSNFLLKLGAKPCLSAYDIVDDFKARYPALKSALPLFGKAEKEEKKPKKKKSVSLKKKMKGFIFPGAERAEEEKPVPPQYDFILVEEEEKRRQAEAPHLVSPLPTLSEEEREIYSALGFEPVHTDSLVNGERSAAAVLRILTKLEIKGLVRKAPGGKYVLADRAEA